MEIYVLSLKNEGIRTFLRASNAFSFTVKWLESKGLCTDEVYKDLYESYEMNGFTSFRFEDLVSCCWTEVEDYKEER